MTPPLAPKLQRLALFNVCLGQFMSALDSRSVNVALPTLSVYFDASMAVVQWIPLALAFYLQGILHFTPTQVGLTIIFFSLVIVVLAPVGGWLADRLGSRMLCTVGSVLTAISMFGFAQLGASSSQSAVMTPLMLLGLGWSA